MHWRLISSLRIGTRSEFVFCTNRMSTHRTAGLSLPSKFSPKTQLLLDRTIGKTEQERILARIMPHLHPTRYHKRIPALPVNDCITDLGATAALGNRKHGCIGRTIRFSLKSFWQQLHVRRHRPAWHSRRSSGCIGLTYLDFNPWQSSHSSANFMVSKASRVRSNG